MLIRIIAQKIGMNNSNLLNRVYHSLEWGLNSPPKPYAFTSCEAFAKHLRSICEASSLQSGLFNIIKRNLLFQLSINNARFYYRHLVLKGGGVR